MQPADVDVVIVSADRSPCSGTLLPAARGDVTTATDPRGQGRTRWAMRRPVQSDAVHFLAGCRTFIRVLLRYCGKRDEHQTGKQQERSSNCKLIARARQRKRRNEKTAFKKVGNR